MPHARKRFGQHFLVDPAVIERIVAAIDPRPGEALVEIGPGRGALTAPLLARTGALTVIELDRDLAARLKRTPGLEVIEADVLERRLRRACRRRGAAEAAHRRQSALQHLDADPVPSARRERGGR